MTSFIQEKKITLEIFRWKSFHRLGYKRFPFSKAFDLRRGRQTEWQSDVKFVKVTVWNRKYAYDKYMSQRTPFSGALCGTRSAALGTGGMFGTFHLSLRLPGWHSNLKFRIGGTFTQDCHHTLAHTPDDGSSALHGNTRSWNNTGWKLDMVRRRCR